MLCFRHWNQYWYFQCKADVYLQEMMKIPQNQQKTPPSGQDTEYNQWQMCLCVFLGIKAKNNAHQTMND